MPDELFMAPKLRISRFLTTSRRVYLGIFLISSCVLMMELILTRMVTGFLFPLSFSIGMPMPLGIHWLRQHSPKMIPWAWGVNGSASVLGSIITVLIAINFGFDQALCLAAMLYAMSVVVISVEA